MNIRITILVSIIIISICCIKQPIQSKYPNPFSPVTQISYNVHNSSQVIFVLYDIDGKTVDTLENKFQLPGTYTIELDSLILKTGIYFYKLKIGELIITKKILL